MNATQRKRYQLSITRESSRRSSRDAQMAYTPHVLVAFGGTWTGETTELWENTIRLASEGPLGDALDEAAYMEAIATPLATWFNGANHMCSQAQLSFLKVNRINALGHYASSTDTNVHDYAAGTVVGASGVRGPQFCTLAYTWETAAKRGPAHRGRIYPPNATYDLVGSFRVSPANAVVNAVAGLDLLTVLHNAGGGSGLVGFPIVASSIGGVIHPITGVTSDDVYDVQRRRKNRIKPARSAISACSWS